MPGRPRKNFVSSRGRKAAVSPQQFEFEFAAEKVRVGNIIHTACEDMRLALPKGFYAHKWNKGKRARGLISKFEVKMLGMVYAQLNAGLNAQVYNWRKNERRKTP